MREIGVFCGTFNPIHWGHLMLAEFACDQFKLEKVYVVVSPNPPHRSDVLLDAEQRYELVEAACADNHHFIPSRIELERSGPSYTVDTLRQLKDMEEKNGADMRLNFLVGQDNLPYLKEWHESNELFSLCRMLIATRTSSVTREEVLKEVPAQASFELIDFPRVPVSSSSVRARLKEGKTVMYLVHPRVNEIIEKKGLFKIQTPAAG